MLRWQKKEGKRTFPLQAWPVVKLLVVIKFELVRNMQAPYCWRWSKHFFFPSRGAYCWNKPRQGNDMNPRPIWTGPYLPALKPQGAVPLFSCSDARAPHSAIAGPARPCKLRTCSRVQTQLGSWVSTERTERPASKPRASRPGRASVNVRRIYTYVPG